MRRVCEEVTVNLSHLDWISYPNSSPAEEMITSWGLSCVKSKIDEQSKFSLKWIIVKITKMKKKEEKEGKKAFESDILMLLNHISVFEH